MVVEGRLDAGRGLRGELAGTCLLEQITGTTTSDDLQVLIAPASIYDLKISRDEYARAQQVVFDEVRNDCVDREFLQFTVGRRRVTRPDSRT